MDNSRQCCPVTRCIIPTASCCGHGTQHSRTGAHGRRCFCPCRRLTRTSSTMHQQTRSCCWFDKLRQRTLTTGSGVIGRAVTRILHDGRCCVMADSVTINSVATFEGAGVQAVSAAPVRLPSGTLSSSESSASACASNAARCSAVLPPCWPHQCHYTS
jgi:hypothetical protein